MLGQSKADKLVEWRQMEGLERVLIERGIDGVKRVMLIKTCI